MPLTKKEGKRLAELTEKEKGLSEAEIAKGSTEAGALKSASEGMGEEGVELENLRQTKILEEEEPEEEEPAFPTKVKINEKVEVYDETRGRWYDAQWNIFGAGEDIEYAPISIAVAGTYGIVAGIQGRKIIITSISFTVDGECNITLSSSYGAISGAMPFGATGQPMGMAAGTGAYFIPLQEGAGFNMTVDADVNVGGFVTYVRR